MWPNFPVVAFIRMHWHGLMHTFDSDHQLFVYATSHDRIPIIFTRYRALWCSCGRVFYGTVRDVARAQAIYEKFGKELDEDE